MSDQIISLTASTETLLTRSPFLQGNAANWQSHAGATVYGVFLPGRDARGGMYQRFLGDGAQFQFTEDDVVNLANAPVTGAVTDATKLSTVVMVNGTIYQRVAPTAVPGEDEFKITAGSAGTATVTFTGVPADAGTITIDDGTNAATEFEFDTDGDGLTGAGTEVDTSASTTAADAAAAFATAVNSVVATLTVTAYDNGDGTVTLVSDTAGEIADLAVTDAATNVTVVDFAGDADDTITLSFGLDYAPIDGAKIEVYHVASASIQSITVPANGVPAQGTCYEAVIASAAATVTRLTR